MRDLSVQAANAGGLNADAKGNIQTEIAQLKSELNRIADTTKFNGKKLLDGSFSANFQVGANAGETIAVAVGTAMGAAGLGVDGVDVTAPALHRRRPLGPGRGGHHAAAADVTAGPHAVDVDDPSRRSSTLDGTIGFVARPSTCPRSTRADTNRALSQTAPSTS